MSDFILIGYIAKAFGTKGGAFIKLFNQDSEALAVGREIKLKPRVSPEVFLTISEVLDKGRVFFSGITDRSAADRLKGAEVFLKRSDLPPVNDDEFYLVDLMGASVVDTKKNLVGIVVGFSTNNAQTLFEVKMANGHIASIPSVKPIIQNIDYQEKIITIDAPLGLLEPLV